MTRGILFALLIGTALGGAGVYFVAHKPTALPLTNSSEVSSGSATTPQSGAAQSSTGNTTKPTTITTTTTTSATVIGKAYTQAELLAMAGSVDLTNLPLGDRKYTTSAPKKGAVYLCNVMSGGQGAQGNGPWIHGATWDATSKVAVQGSVPWPNATVKVSVSGTTRTITSNNLPTNHNTGTFPIGASDPAAQYDRNQSSITAHNNSLSVPTTPTVRTSPDCIYGLVGIMTNGVLINDAFDALYRDAPAHEVQDSCDGHPNNEEGYHYHNLSACFKSPSVDQVIGWADDGFPITGPLVATGKYLTTDDLDECHGLTSAVSIDDKPVTTYHYVMTYDFPYSVSCFRGKSYEPHPGGSSTSSGQSGQGSMMPPMQGGFPPPPPQY